MRACRAQRGGVVNDEQVCLFLFASESKVMWCGFSMGLGAESLSIMGFIALMSPSPVSLSRCPCWAIRRCPGPCALGAGTGTGSAPAPGTGLQWGPHKCPFISMGPPPHKVQLGVGSALSTGSPVGAEPP